MDKTPMIRIEGLKKIYGSGQTAVAALGGVSLTIMKGDIHGIIGMSGAGKSTLIRCINRLDTPTEGRILIDGQDILAMNPKDLRAMRKRVSMIFQQFNLLMQRTAAKNVRYPLEISGVNKAEANKRVMELLDIVGLTSKADAYPAQLSGGQKQRVAIARALASNPEVLLCDEATSALDPKTTQAILELIRQINRDTGITVIVITHQMSVVQEICNRVAILEHGAVVEEGDVSQVFSSPKAAATRALVFPEMSGGDTQCGSGYGQLVRLVFDGSITTNKPLIASMAMDCGIAPNILGASTRTVGKREYGYMLIEIPGGPDELARALKYIAQVPNVAVQVEAQYTGREAAE